MTFNHTLNLGTFCWLWHHQLQRNIYKTSGHIRQGDPQELGIPACTVACSWVDGQQGVFHAVGHFTEVGVAYGVHDQPLDLDVWRDKECLNGLCLEKWTKW